MLVSEREKKTQRDRERGRGERGEGSESVNKLEETRIERVRDAEMGGQKEDEM